MHVEELITHRVDAVNASDAYAMLLDPASQFLGVVIDWRNRHCEFGRFFLCAGETRGKGYGKEALELILGFGFNHLNMAKIYCTTYLDNHRALSLYESVGFKRDGVLRQHIFRQGKYADLALLSILSDEWSDRKGTKS